jgi:hypothetical protein
VSRGRGDFLSSRHRPLRPPPQPEHATEYSLDGDGKWRMTGDREDGGCRAIAPGSGRRAAWRREGEGPMSDNALGSGRVS